jgi:hypothetical protein
VPAVLRGQQVHRVLGGVVGDQGRGEHRARAPLLDRGDGLLDRLQRGGRRPGQQVELEVVGREDVRDREDDVPQQLLDPGRTNTPRPTSPITGSQQYTAAGLAALTRATAPSTDWPMSAEPR